MLNKFANYILKNRLIIFITVLSLVLRLVFSIDNVKALFVDIESYDNYAKVLLTDGVFAVSAYHPPVYPFFIALVYKLFGFGYFSVYVVQSVLGAINTLLIFLIAKNVFNRRIGHLSAGMSLLYWPLTLYSGILLSEIVFLFFLLLGVFFFLKGMDTHKAGYFALCGLTIALSTLTRSINLFVPLILSCVYLLMNRNKVRLVLRNSAVLIIVFCIVMTPWALRNYIIYDAFIPVDTLGGVNLYIGNNEHATGLFVDISQDPLNFEGENDYENDKVLKEAAVKYILSHPVRFVSLTIKRAFMYITFDFSEFDWVLTTYIEQNVIFTNLFWSIFTDFGFIQILIYLGLMLLILCNSKKGTQIWRNVVIYMSIVCIYYFQSNIIILIWKTLSEVFNRYDINIYFVAYINILNEQLKHGWYLLMYNNNITFWVLGVAGAYKLCSNKKGLVILGFIAYYFATTSVFYIQSRYRLPVIPFMAISAALLVDKLLLKFKLYNDYVPESI